MKENAYINNPEFPFKKLNIEKIEKIRKSVSLCNKSGINNSKSREHSLDKKVADNVKNKDLERMNSCTLSKNVNNKNKKKNFIERNIEKISMLSKKK